MNLIAAAIIGIAVIVLLIAVCKVHPFLSLLITTVFAMVALGYMQKFSRDAVNGMVGQSFGSVAGIILIVAAGGGADDILRVVSTMRAQFGGHVTKIDEIATH